MRNLAYIKLNIQTPCPPRGAVPVNQGSCRSNALITANASINVDGLGYGSDAVPGAGLQSSISGHGSGAGHGGAGQASFNDYGPGVPSDSCPGGGTYYGSAAAPVTLGSGGGSPDYGGVGGAGGGAIRLTVAGALQLDGAISANGLTTGVNYSGSGSGGSIWITADLLTGNGSVSAQGGAAASYGAAGGGGRTALYTYSKAGFDTNHISAAGAGMGTLVFGYPPPCANAEVIGSALRLAWRAGDGGSYQVWSSPDLVNWSLYGPVRVGQGDILTQDCPMTNSPAMFFRVQLGD